MIEFSNIFGDEEDKEKRKFSSEGKKDEDSSKIDFSSLREKPQEVKKDKNSSPIDFSSLETRGTEEDKAEPAFSPVSKDLYNRAIALAEKTFTSDTKIASLQIKEIGKLMEELIECALSGNQELFEYVFTPPLQDKNYLFINLVNVCILSLEMGAGLGYSRSKLLKLGTLAFLHDMGIRKFTQSSEQPAALSLHDVMRKDRHLLIKGEILKDAYLNFSSLIFDIINYLNKQIDSPDYMRNLEEEEADEFVRIICLIDTYEGLIHSQPPHSNNAPLDVLKGIIRNKSVFPPRLVKVFIDKVGMYPRGTSVKLNTKEIAKVTRQNHHRPSSPAVRVVYNAAGNKLEKGRTIDLSQGTKIYITRSL